MSSVWRVSSSWSFIGLTSTSVTSQVGTLARYVLMSPTDLFRITLQDALGRVVLFRRTLTSIQALTWLYNMYTQIPKQFFKTKRPFKQILIIATAGCWPAWPLVVRDPIKILVPSPFPSSASAPPPSVTQSGILKQQLPTKYQYSVAPTGSFLVQLLHLHLDLHVESLWSFSFWAKLTSSAFVFSMSRRRRMIFHCGWEESTEVWETIYFACSNWLINQIFCRIIQRYVIVHHT